MKPSKKKTCQPKKDTSRIDTYFKVPAKILDLEEKNVSDETDLKAVYIAALKTKLRG